MAKVKRSKEVRSALLFATLTPMDYGATQVFPLQKLAQP